MEEKKERKKGIHRDMVVKPQSAKIKVKILKRARESASKKGADIVLILLATTENKIQGILS